MRKKGKNISKELWHGQERLKSIGGPRQYSLLESAQEMSRRSGNRRLPLRSSPEDQERQAVRSVVLRLVEENQRRQWNNSHAPESHPGLYQDQKGRPVHREDIEATDGRSWFPEDTLDTLGGEMEERP